MAALRRAARAAAGPEVEVEALGAVVTPASPGRADCGAPGHATVGDPAAFTAVTLAGDRVFSRTHRCPGTADRLLTCADWSRWFLEGERHAFVEADIEERSADDLDIVEREIKLDAPTDPRAAARLIRIGDGVHLASGTPVPDVHFHRVYDVAESGLFEMTSDPAAGPDCSSTSTRSGHRRRSWSRPPTSSSGAWWPPSPLEPIPTGSASPRTSTATG
ncbi:hypothetical protein [Streptomyces erythrochromogenes]|uniref:hypothetical protein n=1 Tax=Streptomyces erythrochromogenes TaxID=285574 RepID=UPI00367D1105